MGTFQNFFSFTLERPGSSLDTRVLRNVMSAGVQALYLILDNASRNLASSLD